LTSSKSPDFESAQFIRGYDFVDRDPYAFDRNGHGTHVASTIAEATDNSYGLTGLAYGARIHDQCPRRANFDAGQFVEVFDDEAARKAWCLYHVGCKGPATFSPCPIFQWNGETSWPIGAGHPCLGCTEPHFWDTMTPFYDRLPDVGGFGIEQRVDVLGAALAIGATAGVLAHAAATGVHQMRERKRQLPVVQPPTGGTGTGTPKA